MLLPCRIGNKVLSDFQYDIGASRNMCVLAHCVAGKEAGIGCVITHRAAQCPLQSGDQWVGNAPVSGRENADFPWSARTVHKLRRKAVDREKCNVSLRGCAGNRIVVGRI